MFAYNMIEWRWLIEGCIGRRFKVFFSFYRWDSISTVLMLYNVIDLRFRLFKKLLMRESTFTYINVNLLLVS